MTTLSFETVSEKLTALLKNVDPEKTTTKDIFRQLTDELGNDVKHYKQEIREAIATFFETRQNENPCEEIDDSVKFCVELSKSWHLRAIEVSGKHYIELFCKDDDDDGSNPLSGHSIRLSLDDFETLFDSIKDINWADLDGENELNIDMNSERSLTIKRQGDVLQWQWTSGSNEASDAIQFETDFGVIETLEGHKNEILGKLRAVDKKGPSQRGTSYAQSGCSSQGAGYFVESKCYFQGGTYSFKSGSSSQEDAYFVEAKWSVQGGTKRTSLEKSSKTTPKKAQKVDVEIEEVLSERGTKRTSLPKKSLLAAPRKAQKVEKIPSPRGKKRASPLQRSPTPTTTPKKAQKTMLPGNYVYATELANKVFLTVADFRGKMRADLRRYYTEKNSGQLCPTHKGLSMDKQQFTLLIESIEDLKKAVTEKNTDFSVEIANHRKATVSHFSGRYLVDLREYYLPKGANELKHGRKGISFDVKLLDVLSREADTIMEFMD